MSKHSHWATIKHQKALKDAQRGKRFTGLLRAIRVAAQKGGGDPEANPTLRAAVEKSKEFNMPRETIERAIKRGTGELGGGRLEEVTFEGYGPEGVAIVVEALTDNRNRTTAEIRKIFERHGGSLGEQGSAAYIFKDPEKPLFEVKIEDREAAEKVLNLVNVLDDHDDVQNVLANFDVPDEILSQ